MCTASWRSCEGGGGWTWRSAMRPWRLCRLLLVQSYLFALPTFRSLVPMCKSIPSGKHLGEKALLWQVNMGLKSTPACVAFLLQYEDTSDRMACSWGLSREMARTQRGRTSLDGVVWSSFLWVPEGMYLKVVFGEGQG